MEPHLSRDEILTKLTESLSTRLTQAMEAMTGNSQRCNVIPEPPEATTGTAGIEYLGWSASYTNDPKIQLRIFATAASWELLSKTILIAAGLDSFDDATLKGTYTETLAQGASAWAQDLSSLAGKKWELASSNIVPFEEATNQAWAYLFPFGDENAKLAVHISDELMREMTQPAATAPSAAPATGGGGGGTGAVEASITTSHFELLLDVELPVSVSFGRALVSLKEVLKLNSGSIVELNRAVTEPVEVIVNNCVIARGEVVVVEGNYGVRIQQIISRQDRLRTVN